jgi:hypothetical protein
VASPVSPGGQNPARRWLILLILQAALYGVLLVAWVLGAYAAAGGDEVPPPGAGHRTAVVAITIGAIALAAATGIGAWALCARSRVMLIAEACCAALVVAMTIKAAVPAIRSDAATLNPAMTAGQASARDRAYISAALAAVPFLVAARPHDLTYSVSRCTVNSAGVVISAEWQTSPLSPSSRRQAVTAVLGYWRRQGLPVYSSRLNSDTPQAEATTSDHFTLDLTTNDDGSMTLHADSVCIASSHAPPVPGP